MKYKLVNVYGVRDEAFTAELILPAEDGFGGIVGVFEPEGDGNIAKGVSIYNVFAEDIEDTGETIDRNPIEDGEELVYTPQLV